jgi:hypothetical protein
MTGIQSKSFDQPDEAMEYGEKGRGEIVTINDVMVVRSILEPGWSWLEHIKPTVPELDNCPLHHKEYVVSGRIRYEMADGGSVEAGAGTYLDIEPGHLASVVGDETCVLIDFAEDWGQEET